MIYNCFGFFIAQTIKYNLEKEKNKPSSIKLSDKCSNIIFLNIVIFYHNIKCHCLKLNQVILRSPKLYI